MAIPKGDDDKRLEEGRRTEVGTAISVAFVGVFILIVYLVMFGFYMSRV